MIVVGQLFVGWFRVKELRICVITVVVAESNWFCSVVM